MNYRRADVAVGIRDGIGGLPDIMYGLRYISRTGAVSITVARLSTTQR